MVDNLAIVIIGTFLVSRPSNSSSLVECLNNASISIPIEELVAMKYELEHAFASVTDSETAARAIALIEVLVVHDNKHRADHLYRLALLYFNYHKHKLRTLYFIKALNLFIQYYELKDSPRFTARAPKVLIRAAYCARVIGLGNLAMQFLDELNIAFPRYRPSEIEKKFIKHAKS